MRITRSMDAKPLLILAGIALLAKMFSAKKAVTGASLPVTGASLPISQLPFALVEDTVIYRPLVTTAVVVNQSGQVVSGSLANTIVAQAQGQPMAVAAQVTKLLNERDSWQAQIDGLIAARDYGTPWPGAGGMSAGNINNMIASYQQNIGRLGLEMGWQ